MPSARLPITRLSRITLFCTSPLVQSIEASSQIPLAPFEVTSQLATVLPADFSSTPRSPLPATVQATIRLPVGLLSGAEKTTPRRRLSEIVLFSIEQPTAPRVKTMPS